MRGWDLLYKDIYKNGRRPICHHHVGAISDLILTKLFRICVLLDKITDYKVEIKRFIIAMKLKLLIILELHRPSPLTRQSSAGLPTMVYTVSILAS